MSHVLSSRRDSDCNRAFAAYRSYLASVESHFPRGAYALATSDWYFGASKGEHGPHDSRLLDCVISESGEFDRYESPYIKIRPREAYDDGFIELIYPAVFNFTISYKGNGTGHQDWRYDEFRLSDSGHVLHEIEWSGAHETGNWLIEANDVLYTWTPRARLDPDIKPN